MSRPCAGNCRDLTKSSHESRYEPIYVFVIASELWQSQEIASADFASVAMTGKGGVSQ